jgi:hypothetical protein
LEGALAKYHAPGPDFTITRQDHADAAPPSTKSDQAFLHTKPLELQ